MPRTERTCTRCGIPFSSDKLGDLCPACLIANTLDIEVPAEGPAFWEDPAPPASKPARTFSHFELLDELGRGGMGVVYRARDLNTERIIALKVLQAHHLEVEDLVQRFRSEVRAVGSLDHPHVLPIHEVGEYEGIPFFSMKLTTGGSLAHNIGRFLGNPKEAAELLAKVSRGVQHAHERGILHRDLKPGNILLDSAGEPYVCDFGLAKWLEDDRQLTMTAAVLGTPHYIAPEQASGSKGLTTAVDIYSLGAILYELLTGRPPFVGGSVLETLVASQEKTPDRPSSLVKNVPRDLETICLKALQHDPANRYPTAGAFADDLENWLAGKPIQARPVGAAEQLWRWAKRNPLPATLVAALFLALVGIALGTSIAAVRIDHERDRARRAEIDANTQLFLALHAQAKAAVQSGVSGQRFDALAALKKAAELKPLPELRTAAITALSLCDLRILTKWRVRENPLAQPIRYSRELDLVFVASSDGDIELREIETNRIRRTLRGAGVGILSISHPGVQTVAARTTNQKVLVWNHLTSELMASLDVPPPQTRHERWINDFAISPDERRLALLSPSGIRIVNFDGSPEIRINTEVKPSVLAFRPDGELLAVAGGVSQAIEVWEIGREPKRIETIQTPAETMHMDWDPAGERLAIGCRDYGIHLFKLGKPNPEVVLRGHMQDVTQVCFANKGALLASTSRDRTIRLWDLRTGLQQVEIAGVGSEASLRFDPSDTRLSATDHANDAVILEVAGRQRALSTWSGADDSAFAALVSSIAFSPSDQLLATCGFGSVTLWSLQSFQKLQTIFVQGNRETSARFLAENELLVASNGEAPRIYRVRPNGAFSLSETLKLPHGFSGLLGSQTSRQDAGYSFVNSKDGSVLGIQLKREANWVLQDQPHVWDAIADTQRNWVALAFSGRSNRGVTVCDPSTGKIIQELDTGAAGTLALSPDGMHLVTCGANGGIVWDVANWSKVRELKTANIGSDIQSCTFSRDGRFLAVSTTNIIVLLDANTYEEIAVLHSRTFPNNKSRLGFSPSGKLLIAQGADNTICAWHLDFIQSELRELGLGF